MLLISIKPAQFTLYHCSMSEWTGKKQARGESVENTRALWFFKSEKAGLVNWVSPGEKRITVMNTKHGLSLTMHRIHSREAVGHENSCVCSYLHCLGSFPIGGIWSESMIKTHPLRILIILSKSLLNSSCINMYLPTDMPAKTESVLLFTSTCWCLPLH